MIELKHNSLSSVYRDPIGAVRTGSSICLKLESSSGDCHVKLAVSGEVPWHEYDMTYRDGLWEYQLQLPEHADILWYYFVIYQKEGLRYYGAVSGRTVGDGQIYSNNPPAFQLTVFDREFDTPAWFRGSVMYQIFPDRFCRGNRRNLEIGARYHEAMGRKIFVHEDWEERPLFRPLDGEEFYSPCDYFGGDLEGIMEQLDYLVSLGASCIYLNPIVEASSNHRYNTANYKKVDPILGTNDDFARLCKKAKEKGIKIILDGVFSHTGADSIYFNQNNSYQDPGAYQGEYSPYHNWYTFFDSREEYKSWWGFKSLPEVNEEDEAWQEYIMTGTDSVFAHWIQLGASGYRLDVADELPDSVIAKMRLATKKSDQDKVLIGEVWEDATLKESYGVKRRYALGRELDSVMNYPFRKSCIEFLLGHMDAAKLCQFFAGQYANYPKPMYYALMNLLSSHDVTRIRTVLGTGMEGDSMNRDEQAAYVVGYKEDELGALRTRLAAVLQFVIPGVPCIYYGDEYGMQGFRDPFNRGTFEKRDSAVKVYMQKLAQMRNASDALKTGGFSLHEFDADCLGVLRFVTHGRDMFGIPAKNEVILAVLNRSSGKKTISFKLDQFELCIEKEDLDYLKQYRAGRMELLSGNAALSQEGSAVTLEPYGYAVYRLVSV